MSSKPSRPTPVSGEPKLAEVTPLRAEGHKFDTEVNPVIQADQDSFPLAAEPTSDKPTTKSDLDAVAELAAAHDQILGEIEKRIIGQRRVIEQLLVALFAR